MKTIAAQRRRFGYRKIGISVRREGIVANHKRIYAFTRKKALPSGVASDDICALLAAKRRRQ